MNSFANLRNHPKTTFAGVLLGAVTIFTVFMQQGVTLGNLGTGTVVSLVIGVCTALLGMLARDPGAAQAGVQNPMGAKADSTLRAVLVFALLGVLLTSIARGQGVLPTPIAPVASSSAGFVASTDALAIGGPGGWSAGSRSNEDFDLLDFGATKSNRLFLEGVELLAPTAGFSIYGGGVKLQPDISALLKKTNLPSGNFMAFLDASAGNTIYATGPSHAGVIVGGGLQYIPNDTMTWDTLRFDEILSGSNHYPSLSMGISLFFGGTPAAASVSPNVKRALLRRVTAASAAAAR